MKKIYLAIAVLGTTIGSVSAQGVYLKVGAGYNIPLTTTAYTDQSVSSGSLTTKFNGVNLAKGFMPTLSLGYMFTKNIGLELGAGYSLGTDNVVTQTGPQGPATVTNKQTIRANMLALYPAVVLEQQLGLSNVSIYTRAGLAVPVAGSTKVKNNVVAVAGSNTVSNTDAEATIYGAPTLGASGALGFNFAINESMALFAEVRGQALKVWAKKSEITKYYESVSGTDGLAAMKTYQKQTNYVTTLNSSSNNLTYNASYSADKPKDEIRGKEANFDAIGVAIGLHIRF